MVELERDREAVIGNSWIDRVEKHFIEETAEPYDGTLIYHLLEALRLKVSCTKDLQPPIDVKISMLRQIPYSRILMTCSRNTGLHFSTHFSTLSPHSSFIFTM